MAGGTYMAGGHAWQGGVCGRSCAWQGIMHGGGMCGGGHACHTCPPPTHYEIRSVNARAVRILLECILVVTACH